MLDEVLEVDGFAAPGWGGVRDAFAENFARRGEAGAAVCVYHNGRPVVDLAAGTADPATGHAYTRDTLQPVMSVSKGIVAIAVNMLADRRAIDLDVPVARYWPEFAQAGKQDIPVRWLLTHRAGLPAIRKPLPTRALFSWEAMTTAL